jgi:hypothetical protein
MNVMIWTSTSCTPYLFYDELCISAHFKLPLNIFIQLIWTCNPFTCFFDTASALAGADCASTTGPSCTRPPHLLEFAQKIANLSPSIGLDCFPTFLSWRRIPSLECSAYHRYLLPCTESTSTFDSHHYIESAKVISTASATNSY